MLGRSMMVALLALGGAWAAGGTAGAAPPAGTVSTGARAGTAPTLNAAQTSAAAGNPVSTNASPLPPPPPSSVNPTVSSQNTVPPTPAPATAGLPSPPTSPVLPSAQGLPASVTNELRPSPSLDAAQVSNVQATLAAGGLYRGPIDGNMSASLRASIREFQRISALPQSGDLDAQTLALLNRSSSTSSIGSNGTTSTSGNLSASQPFSTVLTNVPATGNPNPAQGGTATFSAPFQLSSPINTSTTPPPGTLIQP